MLCNSTFLHSIDKYSKILNPFLEKLKICILEIGIKYLTSQKGQKMLKGTRNKIFEFRSKPLKGHRFLFVFGYQLDNPSINKFDIVLCDYVPDHDDISQQANAITSLSEIKPIELFQDAQIDAKDNKVQEHLFKRIYYYPTHTQHFLPILSEEQRKLVNSNEKYVLIEGVAGSGKTNLCVAKILQSIENFSNILYTTYSLSLLNRTHEIINETYVKTLFRLRNNISDGLSNENINDISFLNLNVDLNDVVNAEKEITNIIDKLNKVKFNLTENLYHSLLNGTKKIVDFNTFCNLFEDVKYFTYEVKNRLNKSGLSLELVFNELEGVILGVYNKSLDYITFEEYLEKRENELSKNELKLIYDIALAYIKCLERNSKYIDKNQIANLFINSNSLKSYFDISILDEVQDFTQRELFMFKHISNQIFAVGDPSQMINPSFFSFAYTKAEVFKEECLSKVLELTYRNTNKLNSVVNNFNELIKRNLGYHSNITRKSTSIGDDDNTYLYFCKSNSILEKINSSDFDDYIVVVSSEKEKEYMKSLFPKKEIFTISDVKGLENNTVLLANVLSTNRTHFEDVKIDKKITGENSINRYYYNLFYVGITRAKQHLVVIENEELSLFNTFLANNFEELNQNADIEELTQKLDLKILTDEERLDKINKAIENEKFEIFLHHLNLIKDVQIAKNQRVRYNIYYEFVINNDLEKAREMFIKNKLFEDAQTICKKLQQFDEVDFIQGLIDGTFDLSIAYKIYLNTTSDQLQQLSKLEIDKSKKQIRDVSDYLKQFIEEEK